MNEHLVSLVSCSIKAMAMSWMSSESCETLRQVLPLTLMSDKVKISFLILSRHKLRSYPLYEKLYQVLWIMTFGNQTPTMSDRKKFNDENFNFNSYPHPQ